MVACYPGSSLSSRHGTAVSPRLSLWTHPSLVGERIQLFRREQPATPRGIDRLVDEVAAKLRLNAIANCPVDGDDGDALMKGDIGGVKVATVQLIHPRHVAPHAVVGWDGDVDVCGIYITQPVEV